MRSICVGASILMVAAAMTGCAMESADVAGDEMSEDIEMVDSSVDALEAGEGEDLGGTSASGEGRFGVGPGIGVGVGQYGQFPPVKKQLPPSKFCPTQYSQRELSMTAGPGVGPGIGVGVGQYGQFPPAKKMIPPSKFCPSQYPPSPPYPQR